MAEPGTTAVGTKVAVEIVRAAVEAGLLDRMIDAFRKTHRVLVLGSSGVGKTNLQASLTKEAAEAVDHLNRTEIVTRSHIRINNTPFVFTDTPGQEHHESRRKAAIRQEMGRGRVGIINIVSFGFHEGTGNKSDAIDGDGKARPTYLNHCRDLEIQALAEWTSLLGSLDTSAWLITVVNKADLWWHAKVEVMDYYTRGLYAQSLGDAQSLKPVVVPYSATLHKFFGEGLMSGTFDRNDQLRCKAGLLTTLVSAVTEPD
jgi:hypothetical protein